MYKHVTKTAVANICGAVGQETTLKSRAANTHSVLRTVGGIAYCAQVICKIMLMGAVAFAANSAMAQSTKTYKTPVVDDDDFPTVSKAKNNAKTVPYRKKITATLIGDTLIFGGKGSMFYAFGFPSDEYSALIHNKPINHIVIEDEITNMGVFSPIPASYSGTFKIGNGVTRINPNYFTNHKLRAVSIGSSVKKIEYNSFRNCTALERIDIPDNVKEIGERAFESCTGLTSITFGSGVKKIGKNAFSGCSKLKSVVIPANVKTINEGAFSTCVALDTVEIKSKRTSIKKDVFAGNYIVSYSIGGKQKDALKLERSMLGIGLSIGGGSPAFQVGADLFYTLRFSKKVGWNILSLSGSMTPIGADENGEIIYGGALVAAKTGLFFSFVEDYTPNQGVFFSVNGGYGTIDYGGGACYELMFGFFQTRGSTISLSFQHTLGSLEVMGIKDSFNGIYAAVKYAYVF